MSLERGPLLADDSLSGAAWCRAHSHLIDEWLADLFERATSREMDGLALVAIGGYGRSELCPQSDIDVMLVHSRKRDVATIADHVWYPIWDEGLHLGHSVCTVREALGLASDDLDTATALLNSRHVAGDPEVTASLASGATGQWEKRSKSWLTELGARVELRHERAGEVAFRLEPDLKEGRGGLRDVHSLRWAQAARRILLDHDESSLDAAYAVLLDARVELQRHTGRSSNVLVLQDQDAVAAALGVANADVLMSQVAEAARAIAWRSDDTWRRIRSALRGPLGRVSRHTRSLEGGVQMRDGEVHLDNGTDPAADAALVLRTAAAAATNRTVIDRQSLERLAASAPALPDPWPPGARDAFVELLLAGPPAVAVIEALDQRGLWTRVLPEWLPVRARPQRNAYHRYTVDRHLLETTANAARLASRVGRPDLLVIASLLHDLGKGYDGDHTTAGMGLAAPICARMGLPADDIATVVAVIEHHLLLPDVATRRDLDDPTTIERVAAAVGSVERLELLAALTEADSTATGPTAWGPWKAGLVDQLVERVTQVLAGADPRGVIRESFPSAEQLARLAAGGRRFETNADCLTVMADDRPGLFSRVAGVLALHGLDVLRAAAYSTDEGRALEEFHVVDPVRDEVPWERINADLERVLLGRLAINARLAERARTYDRTRPRAPSITRGTVHFDNEASATATVIDVQATDGIGVLFRITRALAELDLDIRSAKVQTLGEQVVDAFYVRDSSGEKITDPHQLGEIERAVLHSLATDAT
ncbi:MAG: glnD [Acidimicrobiales bacterium]|jgi:[protein-PII] uridylyltransferase|nr:glnD [Acidimicrobiales bacterium]